MKFEFQNDSRRIAIDVIEHNGKMQALLPESAISIADVKKNLTLAKIPDDEYVELKWAPWGHDDCKPTRLRQKLVDGGIAARVQMDMARMLYGNGLIYYRRSDLEKLGEDAQPAYIAAIEDWKEENHLETKWFFPQLLNYRYYANSFSEMTLNFNGKYVSRLYHKEAEFCRLSKQNPSNLRIEKIYYSPEFSKGYDRDENQIKEIPLMPWFDKEKFLEKVAKREGKNFAWHSSIQTPGSIYYARPFWEALAKDSGWLENAANVPKIVNAMQNNQITLKYQILIPDDYLEIRIGMEWRNYTQKEREPHITNLINTINNTLSGTDNAFKSITTLFRVDDMGNARGKIEIIPIDDKVKKDSWVPSSAQANIEIVSQLGSHPSMIGITGEGNKMGAGSGSDKRELYNFAIDTNNVEQDMVLEPLALATRINRQSYKDDWDIVWRVNHNRHTTKDNAESGVIPAPSNIQNT